MPAGVSDLKAECPCVGGGSLHTFGETPREEGRRRRRRGRRRRKDSRHHEGNKPLQASRPSRDPKARRRPAASADSEEEEEKAAAAVECRSPVDMGAGLDLLSRENFYLSGFSSDNEQDDGESGSQSVGSVVSTTQDDSEESTLQGTGAARGLAVHRSRVPGVNQAGDGGEEQVLNACVVRDEEGVGRLESFSDETAGRPDGCADVSSSACCCRKGGGQDDGLHKSTASSCSEGAGGDAGHTSRADTMRVRSGGIRMESQAESNRSVAGGRELLVDKERRAAGVDQLVPGEPFSMSESGSSSAWDVQMKHRHTGKWGKKKQLFSSTRSRCRREEPSAPGGQEGPQKRGKDDGGWRVSGEGGVHRALVKEGEVGVSGHNRRKGDGRIFRSAAEDRKRAERPAHLSQLSFSGATRQAASVTAGSSEVGDEGLPKECSTAGCGDPETSVRNLVRGCVRRKSVSFGFDGVAAEAAPTSTTEETGAYSSVCDGRGTPQQLSQAKPGEKQQTCFRRKYEGDKSIGSPGCSTGGSPVFREEGVCEPLGQQKLDSRGSYRRSTGHHVFHRRRKKSTANSAGASQAVEAAMRQRVDSLSGRGYVRQQEISWISSPAEPPKDSDLCSAPPGEAMFDMVVGTAGSSTPLSEAYVTDQGGRSGRQLDGTSCNNALFPAPVQQSRMSSRPVQEEPPHCRQRQRPPPEDIVAQRSDQQKEKGLLQNCERQRRIRSSAKGGRGYYKYYPTPTPPPSPFPLVPGDPPPSPFPYAADGLTRRQLPSWFGTYAGGDHGRCHTRSILSGESEDVYRLSCVGSCSSVPSPYPSSEGGQTRHPFSVSPSPVVEEITVGTVSPPLCSSVGLHSQGPMTKAATTASGVAAGSPSLLLWEQAGTPFRIADGPSLGSCSTLSWGSRASPVSVCSTSQLPLLLCAEALLQKRQPAQQPQASLSEQLDCVRAGPGVFHPAPHRQSGPFPSGIMVSGYSTGGLHLPWSSPCPPSCSSFLCSAPSGPMEKTVLAQALNQSSLSSSRAFCLKMWSAEQEPRGISPSSSFCFPKAPSCGFVFPGRPLTADAVGVHNNGYDNRDHDYIARKFEYLLPDQLFLRRRRNSSEFCTCLGGDGNGGDERDRESCVTVSDTALQLPAEAGQHTQAGRSSWDRGSGAAQTGLFVGNEQVAPSPQFDPAGRRFCQRCGVARPSTCERDGSGRNRGYRSGAGDAGTSAARTSYYQVLGLVGRGTFGHVYECLQFDAFTGRPLGVVAVKMVKNEEAYVRSALKETCFLRILHQAEPTEHVAGDDRFSRELRSDQIDGIAERTRGLRMMQSFTGDGLDTAGPENKPSTKKDEALVENRRVIRLLSEFTYRSHVCLVFELLDIDLYQLQKKRRFRGLPLFIVRQIAVQLLQALAQLQRARIAHCDLKPENVLIHSAAIVGAARSSESRNLRSFDEEDAFPFHPSEGAKRGTSPGRICEEKGGSPVGGRTRESSERFSEVQEPTRIAGRGYRRGRGSKCATERKGREAYEGPFRVSPGYGAVFRNSVELAVGSERTPGDVDGEGLSNQYTRAAKNPRELSEVQHRRQERPSMCCNSRRESSRTRNRSCSSGSLHSLEGLLSPFSRPFVEGLLHSDSSVPSFRRSQTHLECQERSSALPKDTRHPAPFPVERFEPSDQIFGCPTAKASVCGGVGMVMRCRPERGEPAVETGSGCAVLESVRSCLETRSAGTLVSESDEWSMPSRQRGAAASHSLFPHQEGLGFCQRTPSAERYTEGVSRSEMFRPAPPDGKELPRKMPKCLTSRRGSGLSVSKQRCSLRGRTGLHSSRQLRLFIKVIDFSSSCALPKTPLAADPSRVGFLHETADAPPPACLYPQSRYYGAPEVRIAM